MHRDTLVRSERCRVVKTAEILEETEDSEPWRGVELVE